MTGEAGIGKTSLVDTFHAQAARAGGVSIARGQCVEGFGGKESYYPVLEAFGLFMRGPGGAALIRVLAAHAPTWLMQFPYLVGQEQRELLRREILGATRERMLREICEALGFLHPHRQPLTPFPQSERPLTHSFTRLRQLLSAGSAPAHAGAPPSAAPTSTHGSGSSFEAPTRHQSPSPISI